MGKVIRGLFPDPPHEAGTDSVLDEDEPLVALEMIEEDDDE